jgi:hypothetical protein
MSENEIARYILGVVVIPAVAAAVIALPFALRPLRERRVPAEAGIASALMAAFVLSFVNDLGWTAILRQVATVEGDDMPFERWHRVGMVALVLGLAAWGVALARSGEARTRMAVGLGAALVAAVAAALFVEFPGASARSQVELAILVVLAFVGFAAFARRTMLWSSWIVFALLAFLMGESGFAYLATMCGAMSAGSFLVAIVMHFGARRRAGEGEGEPRGQVPDASPRGVAVPIALGTLAAVVAACGRAYDGTAMPSGFWSLAVLVPYMALLGEIVVRPSVMKRRRLLAVIATFVGAALVVGGVVWQRASDAAVEPSTDQELLDMYGG